MKFRLIALALIAASALQAPAALAHGAMTAFYGGQIAEIGALRVEFAVRDGAVRAWVRDLHDQSRPASGKVTLLLGGRKLDLPLTAAPVGLKAEAPVSAKDKLAVILNLEVEGKPVSVRFIQGDLAAPALSTRAEAGRQAFEAVCAACHGSALRGTENGPPLLHPAYAAGSAHGDDVILAAMANGAQSHMWKFGDMPKPKGLKAGQDQDVLAYIRVMQKANGLGGAAQDTAPHAGHGHH